MSQDDALTHLIASVTYTPINMDKDTGARKKKEFTLDILNNDVFHIAKHNNKNYTFWDIWQIV